MTEIHGTWSTANYAMGSSRSFLINSRAAPSLEAYHHPHGPKTGSNSGGRQTKKQKTNILDIFHCVSQLQVGVNSIILCKLFEVTFSSYGNIAYIANLCSAIPRSVTIACLYKN